MSDIEVKKYLPNKAPAQAVQVPDKLEDAFHVFAWLVSRCSEQAALVAHAEQDTFFIETYLEEAAGPGDWIVLDGEEGPAVLEATEFEEQYRPVDD